MKLRRRRAEYAAAELREREEQEVIEFADAAQELEEALTRARED